MATPDQVTLSDDDIDALLSDIESELDEGNPKPVEQPTAVVAETSDNEPFDVDDLLEPSTSGKDIEAATADEIVEEVVEQVEAQVPGDYDDVLTAPTPTSQSQDFSDASDEVGDGVYVRQSKGIVFDPEQFGKDIQFSKYALDKAMMEQPGLYAYYAELAARLQRRADQLKLDTELVEAKLDDQIRQELEADKTRKVTEVMVEKAIKRNPEYILAHKRSLDAKMQATMAKDMLEAIKQRRDMLVQIGKDRREELAGEVRIVAAAKDQQSLRERAVEIMKANTR